MILQEEFIKNGYTDILVGDSAFEFEIDLNDLFEKGHNPDELLGIYISKQKDDLFFLLNGDIMDIDSLCDQWDNRIRVFTIINRKSEAIQKLRYNIVQLIVYSRVNPNKNREGNLLISRKIIIKGNLSQKNHIEISDNESIELPFYMIPSGTFKRNEQQITHLNQLLPKDELLIELMKRKRRKKIKKGKDGILDKSFDQQEFETIKEWIEI